MAKKKNKNRKLRKKQQSKLLKMSSEQLIEKARQTLDRKNARETITIIKQVLKNEPSNQTAKDLIFNAYMLREEQLTKKGMNIEASAILEQAFNYLPDFSVISEENLCKYLAKTSLSLATDAYYSFMQKNRSSKNAEKILADRIFLSEQWHYMNIFDKDHLFRKDIETVKAAKLEMGDGNWENAVKALKPLPRKSPFSEYKMFCKGMAAFYAEDDKKMLQSFDRISQEFNFYPMINDLKTIVSPLESFKKKGHAISKTEYLWEGPVHLDRQIDQLVTALDKDQSNMVKSMTQSISKSLYPKQTEWAAMYILLLLYSKRIIEQKSIYFIEKISENILDEKYFLLLKTKLNYQLSNKPFLSAAQYFDCLKTEFSDAQSQKMAKAMILFQTANRWFEKRPSLSSKGLKYLSKELNIHFNTNEELLIVLVCKALEFDSANRKGYELLAKLPRKSRESKKIIEEQLLFMKDQFNNDPFPCLELATLYYEKHAFRKAETVLKEAMERAPHDNRVIERHVISLLISAEKNYNRNKIHLVERDIQKAREIESKIILPFLTERSIIYDVYQKPDQLLECIEKHTQSLSAVEKFKSLSILCLEADRVITNDKSILKRILADLQKEILTLSGIDILSILSPFPETITPLFPNCSIMELFNSKIDEIFKCLDNKEIISFFDIILSPYNAKKIQKEIKRRLKIADSSSKPLLSFYQVTLLHFENKKHDPDMFYRITEQAQGPLLDELRALSRRLSKHAAQPLKHALESFEFSFIDAPFPFFENKGDASHNNESYDYDFDDGQDELPIDHKNLHDTNFYDDDDEYDEYDEYDEFEDFYDDDDDFYGNAYNELDYDPSEIFVQLNISLDQANRMSTPNQKIITKVVNDFEKFVDAFKVRGAPTYIFDMLTEVIINQPEIRDLIQRTSDFVKKNKVNNISREAKLIFDKVKKRR